MLRITVPPMELWDERINQFVGVQQEYELELEHSLVSISEWEARWHKSFFAKTNKTEEESIDYIRCMTVSPKDVPPEVYQYLSKENLDKIEKYISDPMTATVITDESPNKGKRSREVITSELVRYWMIALTIPVEYETWHINRLLTLIQVCNIKNSPGKKRNPRDIIRRNEAINEARRAKLNTNG